MADPKQPDKEQRPQNEPKKPESKQETSKELSDEDLDGVVGAGGSVAIIRRNAR